jgi:hypothetical protein
LESCKCIPNSQVEFNTCSNCINLPLIQVYRIFRCPEYMARQKFNKIHISKEDGLAYALSMLLNFALLTLILGFPLRACSNTSFPICSPSRSQSVHMKRNSASFASFVILSAIYFLSYSLSAPVHDWGFSVATLAMV